MSNENHADVLITKTYHLASHGTCWKCQVLLTKSTHFSLACLKICLASEILYEPPLIIIHKMMVIPAISILINNECDKQKEHI